MGLNIISVVFLHGRVRGIIIIYHADGAQNMDMNMNTVIIIAYHPQLRHRFFTSAKNVMIPAPR